MKRPIDADPTDPAGDVHSPAPGAGSVAPAVLEALAAAVERAMPSLVALIPREPAAQLGRLGLAGPAGTTEVRAVGRLPAAALGLEGAVSRVTSGPVALDREGDGRTIAGPLPWVAAGQPPPPVTHAGPVPMPVPGPRPVTRSGPMREPVPAGAPPTPPFVPSFPAGPAESPVLRELRRLGPMLATRLHGALEVAVERLALPDVPPGLTADVSRPPDGHRTVVLSAAGGGDLENAVIMLDQFCWGVTVLVANLVRALRTHPGVEPLLTPPGAEGDPTPAEAETAVAAWHGRAHLALGVATAAAVLAEVTPPAVIGREAAIVGAGLGAAALVLAEAPMPAAYAAAATARRRAEYLLPRGSVGHVEPAGHRIGLLEEELAETEDAVFAGNGLVAEVPGGAVIRTGTDGGFVSVRLDVLAGPPEDVEVLGWDEVVEISWTSVAGAASVLGRPLDAGYARLGGHLREQTPPWPGELRLRVHVTGRDEWTGGVTVPGVMVDERYQLIVWEAPRGPEIVHKRSDRLGARLRGEPEPPPDDRPERAYRWVRRASISEGATITVIAGTTDIRAVVRAFGANPAAPRSFWDTRASDDLTMRALAVVAVDGAVVAIEDNAFRGSRPEVLAALSRLGRAGSVFWNVSAGPRLGLAEGGEALFDGFEPGMWQATPAAAEPYLVGLDFEDFRDRAEKCLVAVERFTGYAVQAHDLERIEEADVAYEIPDR
ncbi:hypothetical protein [Pseudofrankia asymbiotica]|uniref:Uncharacterized protein n=1 Tax=Pseudofrankia asymbiotica TaxID=1834516 RepID=A0A1V2IFU6_9ACTN|nr:hypothetical protein [Pseudofrankia asymbiotica]ONH31860.1 hypothetical protein BL253_06835 [Pseudofrankia asymbiotica]